MCDLRKHDIPRNGCAGVLAAEVKIGAAFICLFFTVTMLAAAKASSQSDLTSPGLEYSYTMLTTAGSGETATEHLAGGNGLAAAGHLEDAISEYRAALRIKPDFFEAHANLANALKAKGDLEGAIAESRAALRINPNLAEAHGNLGNALKAKGDAEGAISEYKTALRIKPNLAEAHGNLASALLDRD